MCGDLLTSKINSGDLPMDLKELISRQRDVIIQTRRDLHRIPEPGYTEEKTSAYVVNFLKKNKNLKVQTGIAKYGVMALMETGSPGPTFLIRADMDALPILEQTNLPFASMHHGAMHACGHDAHMAMLLGATTVLTEMKDKLKGNIKFVFQPAEEWPGGAKPMIEAGAMENPKVDYSFACHVWPALPQGTIGVKAGTLLAAMDRFEIKILGKGGHGATPHLCVDALEVGTEVVNALQRIVSRQANPLMPTVVTVGTFNAGTAFNIIPEQAVLSGTTRTYDRNFWVGWQQRIEKVVRGVCQSMGAEYELNYTQGYPPTVNDASMAQIARECAADIVGSGNVPEPESSMGGEDMSFFHEKSKGCYVFLGVGRPGCAGLHNSKFDFNEEILLTGAELHCRMAERLLC
jgi:amidohydrolase